MPIYTKVFRISYQGLFLSGTYVLNNTGRFSVFMRSTLRFWIFLVVPNAWDKPPKITCILMQRLFYYGFNELLTRLDLFCCFNFCYKTDKYSLKMLCIICLFVFKNSLSVNAQQAHAWLTCCVSRLVAQMLPVMAWKKTFSALPDI